MFPVYKDEDFDRLILNPTVVNSRMRSISRHTKCLGQGFLLTRIQLRDDERLVISGDDLREFYYTFKVSSARARRNALAVVYDAEDFREFACWDPALAGRRVVPALSALAMGDSLAVELAQASHLGLLQKEVGACRASVLVVYRAPFPRGPFWEILAIDDHVGIQAVSSATPAEARRDREVFSKADEVYPKVGLCQHPKKKVREADNHTVVGGEIEGRIGTIAAPRLRTAVLIALTLEQIRLRASTPRLFTCLVSCWVQVFLYRRPLLSIFSEVFRIHDTVEAARSAPGGEAVFRLTPVVLKSSSAPAYWLRSPARTSAPSRPSGCTALTPPCPVQASCGRPSPKSSRASYGGSASSLAGTTACLPPFEFTWTTLSSGPGLRFALGAKLPSRPTPKSICPLRSQGSLLP